MCVLHIKFKSFTKLSLFCHNIFGFPENEVLIKKKGNEENYVFSKFKKHLAIFDILKITYLASLDGFKTSQYLEHVFTCTHLPVYCLQAVATGTRDARFCH